MTTRLLKFLARRQQYGVILHARNLLIPDGQQERKLGGMHTWRVVEASSPTEAGDLAAAALVREPDFLEQLWNRDPSGIEVEVEEVERLTSEHRTEDSGYVFYIDDESAC